MESFQITNIKAREILDSRGNPTIECEVTTPLGVFSAAVPSGASTGIYEALELRDKDKSRYLGKGVLKAIDNIHSIIKPRLLGMDCREQKEIDRIMVQELDGSENEWGWCKSKLGANGILAVSLCIARAGAKSNGIPLYQHIAHLSNNPTHKYIMPVPSFNVINGGTHAGNKLAMQEFMILPTGASSFKQALQIGTEIYHSLKQVIADKYGRDATNVGDEGGFAPNIQDNREGLELLMTAIANTPHKDKVQLGMDVAASEFYLQDKNVYDLDFKNITDKKEDQQITGSQLLDMYTTFVNDYPMISIEDPFDQDDWNSYQNMTALLGTNTQVVGDDLLVTNPSRIKKALKDKSCNALLLKVNQIGSLSEAIEAAQLCINNDWGVMVSHRSGETEDHFIADLVVGLQAGQIKTGAPCRSERLSKYNQLLRIEEQLGEQAVYAGKLFRDPRSLLIKQ